MSEGFDLGAYLKEAGVKIDTRAQGQQVEMISIDLIQPHSRNFYKIDGVNELADTILQVGLQQPLVVAENADGKFTIISGHRRWNALKQLVKDGHEEFRDVPCIVDRDPNNTPELLELKLLYANSATRKMSDPDKLEQQKRVEATLVKMAESGVTFKGRLRDQVAKLCQTSRTNIAQLKVIDDRLIPKLKVKWKAGTLATSTAYRIAKLDAADQDLLSTAISADKHFREADVDSYVAAFGKLRARKGCQKTGADNCQHITKMLRRTAGVPLWQKCPGCCLTCTSLMDCKNNCQLANAEKESKKQLVADGKAKLKAEQRKRDAPEILRVEEIYNRISNLICDGSIDPDEYAQKCWWASGSSYFNKLCALIRQDDVEFEAFDYLPFGNYLKLRDADRIIRAAEMLGCSVDYLLGRDVPENWTQEADCHGQSDDRPRNDSGDTGLRWQSGDPFDSGKYICRVQDQFGTLIDDVKFDAEKGWDLSRNEVVVGWIAMPKEEAK